jgi:hypothetical protein
VPIPNIGRAFQAATAASIAEGKQLMATDQTPHAVGYTRILTLLGAEVAAAKPENIADVHQFHSDILQGVAAQTSGHGEGSAVNYMAGFFDGCCHTQGNKTLGAFDLINGLLFYCEALTRFEPRAAASLARIKKFCSMMAQKATQEAFDLDGEAVREMLFHTLEHELHGMKDRGTAIRIEQRLRAFVSGYETTRSVGDPERAWQTYYLVFGRMHRIKESVAHGTIVSAAFQAVCGFVGAAHARSEPCQDIESYLKRYSLGLDHFEVHHPFKATTPTGKRAAAYMAGFNEGVKTAEETTVQDYPALLAKTWPFKPTDLSFHAPQDPDDLHDILDELKARLGAANEPMTEEAARINGWLEAHFHLSLNQ